MANAKHVYLVIDNFVHDDVRPRSKHKLTGIFRHSSAASIRRSPQISHSFINGSGDALSSGRIMFCDAPYDLSQVIRGVRSPANTHLRAEHLLDAFHHFVVLQQVAFAGGSAAFLNGREEAFIVFQHAVDRLLNHLFGIFAGAIGELT